MSDTQESREVVNRVPELMYRSFRCLNHPDRFKIFEALCSQGEVTTKDLESSTELSMKEVNRSLRELERAGLAKHTGQTPPATRDGKDLIRQGDYEGIFNRYTATPHGRNLRLLFSKYDPNNPGLGGAVDPQDLVESFAALNNEELSLLRNRFRDLYYLAATLVSIHYQKHESATSRWLSDCLYDRLTKDDIEKMLNGYTGSDGLLVTTSVQRSILDRGLIRIAQTIAGRDRVNKWLPKASYSLTTKGRKVAEGLVEQFHPRELGIDEQYLQPQKVEADDGILGRVIVQKIIFAGILAGVAVYGWFDLLRKLTLSPSDSVGIAVDLLLFIIGLFGSVLNGIFRLPGLFVRVAYWRKLRREKK